jgi:hypothetical protein
MGDAATPAKRTAAERDLRMQVSLQRVQTSFEQAVGIMTEEVETLQADHAHLQTEHAALQRQHKELQDEYEAAKDSWRTFRQWWKEKVATKQATQQTPNRVAISSPNLQTPGISSSALSSRGKSKLTKSEVVMLDKLGLDSTSFGTPGSEPSSTFKVKREIPAEENELHASPVDRNHSRSDGHIQSRPPSEQSKKRSRSSLGEADRGSPSRRALQDIGNRSVSSGHSEQESPAKMGSNGITESTSGKKRGRGRYSAGDRSRTINEEFEVNPERNGNVSFLHKSVVRHKAERKQMHAHDCECCSEWYKVVGEAPLRRYEDPKKLADQHKAIGGDDEESDIEGEKRRQLHRQQISRHRDYGTGPASTPPLYWNVGFPSTQEAAEANKLTRKEYSEKRDKIARDPRFISRVGKS